MNIQVCSNNFKSQRIWCCQSNNSKGSTKQDQTQRFTTPIICNTDTPQTSTASSCSWKKSHVFNKTKRLPSKVLWFYVIFSSLWEWSRTSTISACSTAAPGLMSSPLNFRLRPSDQNKSCFLSCGCQRWTFLEVEKWERWEREENMKKHKVQMEISWTFWCLHGTCSAQTCQSSL